MKIFSALIFTCMLTSPAFADLVKYQLTGTVIQAASTVFYQAPVMVGQHIPIDITVDTSYPADGSQSYPGSYDSVAGATSLKSIIVAATFAGYSEVGFFQSVTATDTSISFFTGTPMTGQGFSIVLKDARPETLQPGLLPSNLDAGQFAIRTFSVLNLFDVSSGGFSGTVDRSILISEPKTLTITCVSILALAMIRCRRGSIAQKNIN